MKKILFIIGKYVGFLAFIGCLIVLTILFSNILTSCEPSAQASSSSEVLKESFRQGKGWCNNPLNKCYNGVRDRLKQRWVDYGAWFEEFADGTASDKVKMALTSVTEAPSGSCSCSPDKKLKECGIMGLSYISAERCNINAVSPKSSIWCASYLGNLQRISFEQSYPPIVLASEKEIYILSGLSSGVGPIAHYLIKKSGSLEIKEDGTLKYKSPFERVLWFMLNRTDKIEQFFLTKGRKVKWDKVGLRMGRWIAIWKIIDEFYEKELKEQIVWGDAVLKDRPKDLAEYPGYFLHGNCKKFPELANEKPTP